MATSTSPQSQTKSRLQLQDLALLERLKENRDFAIFLDHLRDQVYGKMRSSVKLIVTDEDKAQHNYLMGALNAMQVTIGLVDDLYQHELSKRKQ